MQKNNCNLFYSIVYFSLMILKLKNALVCAIDEQQWQLAMKTVKNTLEKIHVLHRNIPFQSHCTSYYHTCAMQYVNDCWPLQVKTEKQCFIWNTITTDNKKNSSLKEETVPILFYIKVQAQQNKLPSHNSSSLLTIPGHRKGHCLNFHWFWLPKLHANFLHNRHISSQSFQQQLKPNSITLKVWRQRTPLNGGTNSSFYLVCKSHRPPSELLWHNTWL
jgi:hypothetical protein